MLNKLTETQVENWRNLLLGMIGPYARIMPASEIQSMRDNMQSIANEARDEVVQKWQHEDTGSITRSVDSPGPRWYEVPESDACDLCNCGPENCNCAEQGEQE